MKRLRNSSLILSHPRDTRREHSQSHSCAVQARRWAPDARTPAPHTQQSHHTAACRVAEEQNASIFGHKGKAQAQASPEIADEHPPRYRGMPDTPNERLVTVLQEALDVAGGMDPYLLEVCTPASDACNTLGNATETADWGAMYEAGKTMFRFSNAWTTDLVEAKTLAMFAYMLKARRVMEIGMFTGYGALSIAEVRPDSYP